jgi:hypothetical protein
VCPKADVGHPLPSYEIHELFTKGDLSLMGLLLSGFVIGFCQFVAMQYIRCHL